MFYILISYISTIAITKAIDKVSYFSFCKKIYDNGYKFNSEYYDDEEELTERYIDNINTLVNNRLNIAKLIMETNYYNYLFN